MEPETRRWRGLALLAYPSVLLSFLSLRSCRGDFTKPGKGKIRDVRRDLLDPLGVQFEFGPDARNDMARMHVVDHLRDDAVSCQPDLVVVGRQIDHEADQFAE